MNTISSTGRRALVLGGGGSTGNAWLIGIVAGLADRSRRHRRRPDHRHLGRVGRCRAVRPCCTVRPLPTGNDSTGTGTGTGLMPARFTLEAVELRSLLLQAT